MSENENIAIDEQTAPESVSKPSRGAKIAGGFSQGSPVFSSGLSATPQSHFFRSSS